MAPDGSIVPGDSHEFYDEDDIYIYRWDNDGEGWFMADVTP